MKSSRIARRGRTRFASRRSAAAKPTQRLTGFEPLEPRAMLSGLSHFPSDEYSSQGPGNSHGMGAYEKELHSAAGEYRGASGKSEDNERYVEAKYDASPNVTMAMMASPGRCNDDAPLFVPSGRPAPEPTFSPASSILSARPAETEIEPMYSTSAPQLSGYSEEREKEAALSSSSQNGLMSRSTPDSAGYSPVNPILNETSEESPGEYEVPTYSTPAAAFGSISSRPTAIDVSSTPTYVFIGPRAMSYSVELVFARASDTTFAPAAETHVVTVPASAGRLPADAIASASSSYSRSMPVVFFVGVSPDRRTDGPAYVSFIGQRESVSYVVSARGNGSLALSADAESAGSKSTGVATSSFVMSLLNSSSLTPADASDRETTAVGDERANGRPTADQADDAEATGLVDAESAELLLQKRKAALEKAVAKATLASPLERLTDLPAMHEAPFVLREIMQWATDAVMMNLHSESLPAAAQVDDGMIELLASDVSSLFAHRSVPNVEASASAARAVTLEAGVAVYQSFEVGAGDAAASGEVAGNDAATADAGPAAEQLARVE